MQTQVNNGTTGLVRQDAVSGNVTVAGATGGTLVHMAGTAARTVTGVQAGGLSATSTDVVNGSQLFQTNANVTANTNAIAQHTADIATNSTAISNVDNRVTTAEGNITNLDGRVTTVAGSVTNLQTQITNGTTGLVRQDAASGEVTVAGATGGTSVNMTGAAGARAITGVRAGVLSAASTEAINGSQLFEAHANIAANSASINSVAGTTMQHGNQIQALSRRWLKSVSPICRSPRITRARSSGRR
ncbi:hypothetical protein DDE05_23470 [Streptomyces cavourensis]|nr:hypothetical protein DDE05_23470 [Streptomyces cavourensis]